LSSEGVYPQDLLRVDEFALLAVQDFAWSAVHLADLDDGETDRPGCRAGAISWLTPDEIRFFSAVHLAEAHPRTNGRLRIYTQTWYAVLELEEAEALDPVRLVLRSRDVAAGMLTQSPEEGAIDPDRNGTPGTLSRDYTGSVRALLDGMDSADPLLHRGLYKLLMASELQRYPKFLEESATAALISREAALELLRRKHSQMFGNRLKAADVLAHIERVFPTGGTFVEVLGTDWEARVMITHPVSDYGEHWSPPVEAEECFDALTSLTYLYRYLLLDEVWTPAEYD